MVYLDFNVRSKEPCGTESKRNKDPDPNLRVQKV